MDLAGGQKRVHDPARVVHRNHPVDGDVARLGVQLDDHDVGAERERRPVLGVVRQAGQLLIRRRCDLCPGTGHRRRAGHVEGAAFTVQHDVSGCRLKQVGGGLAGQVHQLLRCIGHRRAGYLDGAGPSRGRAGGDDLGVAVEHLDRIQRHAQTVGHDHRPCGVVAGSDRRGTGGGQHGPVATEPDLAVLATAEAGDLHVGGYADAHLDGVSGLASPLLLGPQAYVVGGGQGTVQRSLVVATVHGGTCGGGVREGLGSQQVGPPHLDRIHADLGGEQVHGALDCGGGLGSPGPPVGTRRCRVGGDAHRRELQVGDVVDAAGQLPGELRQERPPLRIGPAVLHHVEAVMGDPAVTGATDRHGLGLCPPVDEGGEVLGTGLDPPDRAADQAGELADDDLLLRDHSLGAESSTDVLHQHPDLGRLHAEALRSAVPEVVRALRAGPVGELPVGERGGHHPWLDGDGCDP